MAAVVSTEELDRQLDELFQRRSMDAFLPWLQQATVHMFESDSKERKVLSEWGLLALRVLLTKIQLIHCGVSCSRWLWASSLCVVVDTE